MTTINKKPTAIGIGRALTSAGMRKETYVASTMVRGYGTIRKGYIICAANAGMLVTYSHFQDFATVSLTDEQIIERQHDANRRFNDKLNLIDSILRAKGFNTRIITEMEDGILKGRVFVSN
jgi:hypothetical protein